MKATNNTQPAAAQAPQVTTTLNRSFFDQIGNYYIKVTEALRQINPKTGQPYAVVEFGKVLTTGKNKGLQKSIERFYYHTDEKASEAIVKYKTRIALIHSNIASDKAQKAEIKANFQNPFVIGDILSSSWGYEQTNVDFYQVKEVKGKFVTVQKIAGEMVEYNRGDSGRIKPLKDQFTTEAPFKKLVSFSGKDTTIKGNYYLNLTSYSSASIYTHGENGQFCSWGY